METVIPLSRHFSGVRISSPDEGTSDDGCGLYLYFDSETAAGNAILRNKDIRHNTLNRNPSPIGNCDGAGLMIYHPGTSGAGRPDFFLIPKAVSSILPFGKGSLYYPHHLILLP
jgi:hypothetical protein